VPRAKALNRCLVNRPTNLTQQLVREQASAHPDLAMNSPHRQLDAFLPERKVPGADMVVDAVDERAVEVEEKGNRVAHHQSGIE